MKLSPVASTFSRELLKDSGASGLNAFLGQCAKEGVGPVVAGLFASGGAAALGILGSASLLIGPILWERHQDKKRQQELATRLAEMCAVLDQAATDADGANRQLAEIAERRQFVWARISGADQADFARRVTEMMRDHLHTMLTDLGQDDSALLGHIDTLKDIAYDSNFRVTSIKADTEALLDGQGQVLERQGEQATKADIDEIKKMLLARQPENSVSQGDPSLDRDLTNALYRVANDAERGIESAKRALKDKNPDALVDHLLEQRTRVDKAESAIAVRIQQEKIELDRELAATSYLIGRICIAESALLRILDLLPNDLDALNQLGHIRNLQGDLDEAKRLYTRVLDDAPDKAWQAIALGNLGLIEQTRGNLDAAQDYLARSLDIHTQLGRKEGMAANLGNLGLIELARGNLDAAQDYHTRALAIETELGSKEGMANQLGNLGLIERTRGNLDTAQDYLARSLDIHTQLGRKEGMAANLGNLGTLEGTRGNLDAAQDYLARALDINTQLGRKEGMAGNLGNLGLIERTRGNMPEACALWHRALALFEQAGAKPQADQTRSLITQYCPDPPDG